MTCLVSVSALAYCTCKHLLPDQYIPSSYRSELRSAYRLVTWYQYCMYLFKGRLYNYLGVHWCAVRSPFSHWCAVRSPFGVGQSRSGCPWAGWLLWCSGRLWPLPGGRIVTVDWYRSGPKLKCIQLTMLTGTPVMALQVIASLTHNV